MLLQQEAGRERTQRRATLSPHTLFLFLPVSNMSDLFLLLVSHGEPDRTAREEWVVFERVFRFFPHVFAFKHLRNTELRPASLPVQAAVLNKALESSDGGRGRS